MTDTLIQQRIQELEREHGNLTEVAKVLHISLSMVSLLKSGRREPSDETAAKLGLRKIVTWARL